MASPSEQRTVELLLLTVFICLVIWIVATSR